MKTIGKYQVKGLLGKGGMGRVYKALLPSVDKIVALKLLSPHDHMQQLLGSEQINALFFNEARTLANINHPHIAGLLDFDYDQTGRPFFVMEYLCMNIGSLIGERYEIEKPTRVLPPNRAFRYIDQILNGLDRLHATGIIHRDIKPYNILLTDDDQVKIIDLGLSRLRGEVTSLPDAFKIGTPYYASPEQAERPDQADERADFYSAGILAWRMMTGTLPPEFETPPPPSSQNPLLGEVWDAVLCKGIDPDPDKRFQTCGEMRLAIQTVFEEWQEKVAKTCQWGPGEPDNAIDRTPKKLRQEPAKVSRDKAVTVLGLDDLHRPAKQEPVDFQQRNSQTVNDAAHRLIWQRSGSPYPLDWHAAHEFISRLNRKNFARINKWRLPTVNELICLIQSKTVLGDYCQPEVFDSEKNRLWSSDKKSYTSAWYVHTDMGYADSQDMTCRFYVRAVSDA